MRFELSDEEERPAGGVRRHAPSRLRPDRATRLGEALQARPASD